MTKNKVKTTDPQQELLTQVDENNIVIGSIPRGVAHKKPGVFYRTIYILVINCKGKIPGNLNSQSPG